MYTQLDGLLNNDFQLQKLQAFLEIDSNNFYKKSAIIRDTYIKETHYAMPHTHSTLIVLLLLLRIFCIFFILSFSLSISHTRTHKYFRVFLGVIYIWVRGKAHTLHSSYSFACAFVLVGSLYFSLSLSLLLPLLIRNEFVRESMVETTLSIE